MPEKEEKINKIKAKAYDRIATEIEDMLNYIPSKDILVLSGMVTAIKWQIEEAKNE